LLGGFNLYQYAPNGLTWIDPWGWSCVPSKRKKPINLPSKKKVKIDMDHILERHSHNGKVALISGKKDLFPKNMSPKQIERAIRKAYSNIKVLKSQDERILGQGTSDNMIIEIWVNKSTRKIETAYPKGFL
jgi:uncharacterized protein RhaS with RHS repeats